MRSLKAVRKSIINVEKAAYTSNHEDAERTPVKEEVRRSTVVFIMVIDGKETTEKSANSQTQSEKFSVKLKPLCSTCLLLGVSRKKSLVALQHLSTGK